MLYNFIRIILSIFICIGMIFSRKLRKFLIKRCFKKIELTNRENTVWIHCASVGEVNLAEPIINKFLNKTKNSILLTMITDTGMETALKRYNNNHKINLLFFPLDDYYCINKILRSINLKKLIIIETEIWPNLISLCSKKSKVVLINGRISDRSINSYKKIKFLLKKVLNKIDIFIMQTEEDKKRIISIGAPQNRVYNYGNLKFNIKIEDYEKSELDDLIKKINPENKTILVAGSTRDQEEEFVLELFDKLDNYLLILVPRHVERTKSIVNNLLKKYKYTRWTKIEKKLLLSQKTNSYKISSETEIILVDKMGELRKLYAIADIVYVGGTMVNIGGHSLLEPLYYRKTPIFGPFIQNIKSISREVLSMNIGIQINDVNTCYTAVQKIIEQDRDKIEIKINDFFEKNSHVVDLTFKKITE